MKKPKSMEAILSKKFLLISLIIFLFSCSNNRQYEKALDYFYPLEKGKIYVYKSYINGFGEITIKRKIEDVIPKSQDVKIVKISEKIGIKGKPDIFEQSCYTFQVKDNLIKLMWKYLIKRTSQNRYKMESKII